MYALLSHFADTFPPSPLNISDISASIREIQLKLGRFHVRLWGRGLISVLQEGREEECSRCYSIFAFAAPYQLRPMFSRSVMLNTVQAFE